MSKNLLLILIGLFSVLTYSYAEIEVRISTEKEEYFEGENIICILSFINNSDLLDLIDIDKFGLYYIKFRPDNVRYTGGFSDRIGPLYKKIFPHTSIDDKFILSQKFVNKILYSNLHGAPGYLINGTYTVQYNYGNKLKSNEINIKIQYPISSEQLVFNKLIKAYKINDGRPWTLDSIILKKDTYYEIVTNNPGSIYWEEAVYRYNEECNWLKIVNADTSVNKEFIRRFPDSFYMKDVLLNLCQALYHSDEGGEPAVILYLNYLIENYQIYCVSGIAKEQLLKKQYLN